MQTIIYILPELFLSIAIMFLLMLGVFIKKSFKLVNLLTILSLIFAIALILNQPNEIIKIFNESYIIDRLAIFMISFGWFRTRTIANIKLKVVSKFTNLKLFLIKTPNIKRNIIVTVSYTH